MLVLYNNKTSELVTACSAINDVTYTLEVTAISPEYGSLLGGTTITLTGAGFGNTSVTLGGVPCDVTSDTETELVCVTGDPTVTHEVTNMGSHVGKRRPTTLRRGTIHYW